MGNLDFPLWFGLGSYGGLIIGLLAASAIAAHALIRKRGTSRQLAHCVLVCLAAACLSFVPIWWNQNRLDLYGPSLPLREVLMALAWTALCGWVIPLGMLVGYTVLAEPQPVGVFVPRRRDSSGDLPSALDDPARQIEPLGANRPWGQLVPLAETGSGQPIALTRQLTLLGREYDNDVVMDDERTSRHHAELRWEQGRVRLLDRGSMNGAIVNHQPARGATPLTSGDVIELGAQRYRIELSPVIAGDTGDLIETRKMASFRRLATQREASALVLVGDRGAKGRRWEIAQALATIGRDAEREICLPDASVSRLHAQIVRQQAGYYLADLQSSNGAYVNGEPLTEPRLLRAGDVIRIGEVVLRCEAAGDGAPVAAPTHPLSDETIAFARSAFSTPAPSLNPTSDDPMPPARPADQPNGADR
ncbi:MAG TPA: FHA domain-containing protein [Ktedonobacterales bacterium]|nr:FHA domain-containing protein [Ktedonobacterales bacterium]